MPHPDRTPRAFPGDELMAARPEAVARLFMPSYDGEEPSYDMAGTTAVICIDGPLMQRGGWLWDGYETIGARFQAALLDPAVRSVLLKISSPGGVAAGCFEAAKAMQAAKQASGKPVMAFADECACSAAYALACVADQIWLPPSGEVGSVGVIATYLDMSKAAEAEGVRAVILSSGKQKADGHPMSGLDEEMVARLQARIDYLAGLFAELVGGARGMAPQAVLALEAGVFAGPEAVRAGLADRVGSLADCLAALDAAAGPKTPMPGRGPANPGRHMHALLAALGLAETASESDGLAAIASLKTAHAQLAELTGKTSAAEALGVVAAWKQGAGKAAELADKLAKLEADQAKAEHEALVQKGLESGQLDTALEAWARSQPKATLEAFLAVAPPRVPGSKPVTQPTEASSLSKPWEELTLAEKHRLYNDDRATYRALKADHERRTRGAQS